MQNENLTFNDLPQVVAQLRDEVMGMKALLTRQQAERSKPVKENCHKPMTVDEAIEYTHIPMGAMYMKLEDGTIPATKPGRRWILYQDKLDKWLETMRRNAVPLTADEKNETILASHASDNFTKTDRDSALKKIFPLFLFTLLTLYYLCSRKPLKGGTHQYTKGVY